MKFFTKLTTVLLALIIIICAVSIPAHAASSATLYFSSNSVKVGDKVTVSVSISPNEKMYGVEFYLQYNDSVLKYDSGNGNENSAGVLKVVESPSGDKSVKYSFTFVAEKAGTSAVSVTDCKYVVNGDNGSEMKKFTGASASMTVKDEKLSKDASLKSLKVSGFSISPEFSSSKTSYTLKVPYDTKKINVSAKTTDSKAKVVSVEGNDDLDVGKNTVTVTVEAESGTQKKYTITVTRKKEDASSEDSSSEETESEEEEEDTDSEPLKTNIAGLDYTISKKIPEDVLLEGFSVKTKTVNGYEVEIATDENSVYEIFYLKSTESKEYYPYLYDEVLDQFERLNALTFGEKYFIFSQIPEDTYIPENLYSSSIDVSGVSVDCLTYTLPELSDIHIVYCYSNGAYVFCRYDTKDQTIQRYPDFLNLLTVNEEEKDGFLFRFSQLSTNGKVIVIALSVLILGILALLILLIVYLFKKSNNHNDYISIDDYEDFEEVDIENNVLK